MGGLQYIGREKNVKFAGAFSSHLKSKVGNILTKAAALRINFNIDGAPIVSRSHTHPIRNSFFIHFPCLKVVDTDSSFHEFFVCLVI